MRSLTIFTPASTSGSEREWSGLNQTVEAESFDLSKIAQFATRGNAAQIEAQEVAPSKIKQNLDKALAALDDVFSSAMHATVGDMHLDEIEIGLEIGSDGSVGIPGIGIKVSGKSSITVRFKRNDGASSKTAGNT